MIEIETLSRFTPLISRSGLPLSRLTRRGLCNSHFSGDCCCKHNIVDMHDLEIITDPVKHLNELKLGGHFQLRNSLLDTIIYANSLGMNTCQVFLGEATSYIFEDISQREKEQINSFCMKNNMTFQVHAPLICNLGRHVDNQIASNARRVLSEELSLMNDLPGSVVVHVGSVGTYNDVADNLRILHQEGGNMRKLLLENPSGAGTQIGSNIEEIRKIFETIDFTDHLGLCIDTQHTFASGMCDFSTYESVIKLFEEIDSIAGCRGTQVVHLNDSKTTLRGFKDRHEAISQGHIWHQNDDSLVALFDIGRDKNINFVLETPNPLQDHDYLRRVYDCE
jgi:deoxyribonuclease-4